MNIKKYIVGLVLVSSFLISTPALAAGLSEAQIQAITSLLSSFGADSTTVNNVNAVLHGQTASGATETSTPYIMLNNNLSLDSTDASTDGEVSKLQQFLGGRVTGYFGPLTLQLMQNWQAAHGIVSSGSPDTTGYGYAGPKTRAAMAEGRNRDSNNQVSIPTFVSPTISEKATTTPPGLEKQATTTPIVATQATTTVSNNGNVSNNSNSNSNGVPAQSTSPLFMCSTPGQMVTICHNGQTLTVSCTATGPEGHSNHSSDTLGACSITPVDTTAPVISGIQTSNITQTTVTVSWTTDEVSSSDVYYSHSSSVLTSGTLRATAAGNITSHSITLSGLSAYSTYYYLVVSKDGAGNTATSSVSNFQTIAEPVVTPTTRTITATAGTGGSISPAGSVVVTQGTNKTFTITANAGYTIASVAVDGVTQGAISTYTFTNVQTTHTISATFAQITYTITVTQGTNGTISPSTTSVVSGGTQTFTITPATGYQITSVSVDGTNQGAISTYTFTNVTTTHTITATFSLIPVTPPCVLTISAAQTTPVAQDISPGQSGVTLVKFNATSNCNGTLNSFAVSLLPMPNGYQNISTLRLYNDATDGQLGTTQTVTGASVNFASVNLPFTANQTLILKVVGDISPSAGIGSTIYGVFGGSSGVTGSSGTIGNNASGNIIAGNTMTIQTPQVACAEPYTFVKTLATFGNGDGQVNVPRGIALDAQSNVYVADTSNHRMQKFDSNGNFITKWGATRGSGDGQFSAPVDVAVDAQGNVYVADNYNYRIQKFDSNGTFLAKWGTQGSGNGQFNSPYGLGLDSSGNVYVADYGNNNIQKFDSNGTFLAKWGTQGNGNGQFDGPMDVAVDAQGNFYVADYASNNRIQKFDSDGNYLLQWGGVSAPSGVVLDSAGNVFVAEMNNNYRISKFDSNGVSISHWNNSSGTGGQLSGPWRVAVDAQGNVYVAEIFPAHRIVKFAPCPSLSVINKPGGANHLASFSRNLTIGSIGEDVKELQTLLVREVNYSADLVTGYFGRMTSSAVKKLQEKYSVIPTSGYFGKITREALTASVSNW